MKIKKWTLTFFVVILLVLMQVSLGSAASQLSIYEGEITTYTVSYPISKLAIGDPTIADYKATAAPKTQQRIDILINGKKPGRTNLIIYDAQGKQSEEIMITVLIKNLEEYKKQITALVGNVEGITFKIIRDKLIIEGEVVSPLDLYRINRVIGNNPQVVMMVMIAPRTLQIIAKTIADKINDENVRVQAVGQQIALIGLVFNKATSDRYEKLAHMYFQGVQNLIEVRQTDFNPSFEEMIQLTAYFMEVDEATIKGWGINWSPLGEANVSANQPIGTGGSFFGAITGVISSLFPKMNTAKENGSARVLEQASMSVRTGEKASFHSGGEMGLPTVQASGAISMTFKKYGILVNVLPVAQGSKISLKMDMEVSAPTGVSPGGGFNFSTSKISSVQWCNSGESIAVGGLISQRDSKLLDKLPENASGAIVQLYKSDDFRKKRSQFVIFLTPTILKTPTEANKDLRKKVDDEFKLYEPDKR